MSGGRFSLAYGTLTIGSEGTVALEAKDVLAFAAVVFVTPFCQKALHGSVGNQKEIPVDAVAMVQGQEMGF